MRFKDSIFGVVALLLAFVLLVLVLFFNYVKDQKLIKLEFQNQRESALALSEDSFRELQNIVEQDLTLLVATYEQNLDTPTFLTSLFQNLLSARENLYLQARVIDLSGMEIIRVDNGHLNTKVASPSELQNKSSRDYFNDTLTMTDNQVYWSLIDLNMERGVIQQPYIATTRAAKVFRNTQGEIKGIVILNLDLNNLYKKINTFVESRELEFFHTDKQGHFSFHPIEALRWGGIFPERKHLTITETITKDIAPILKGIQTVECNEGSILSVQYSPNNGLHSGYIAISTPAERVVSAMLSLKLTYVLYFLSLIVIFSILAFITLRYRNIKSAHQAQIVNSLAEAKGSAEFKSRFLANMSHEIRTPLNAIVGMLFLIKNDDPTPSQLKLIHTLESSCSHLLSIVNDILDFSKIDSNMLKLEKEDFHLHEVLDNIAGISRQLSRDKDIEVLTSFSNDIICELSGDAFRLTQILINLMSNAIKFTHKGHVTLDVNTEVKDNIILARFVISDSGCGMTEETIELIRNPFQQADTSTTRRFGGTGLGISIVDQLTKLMGGNISITSVVNEGSTFAIEIPFERSQTHLSYRPYDQVDFSQLNAIIVDDDPVARDYLANIVKGFGCNVTTFETGEDSLVFYKQSLASNFAIHLIFMDWRLPGEDGLTIAKEMSALCSEKKPVIIMETAYGREIMREEGFSGSINKLLIKPITPSDVFDAVNEQLSIANNQHLPKTQSTIELDELILDGIHVLIVDDNRINQTVCGKILSKLGATFEVADNGAIAIQVLESQHNAFNVVLMDMQMPVLDGVEATKILRTKAMFKDLPIIALTANVSKEDIDICNAAGMNDYASKPIEADKLAKLILQHHIQ
ncbi:response regulator [uncultured Psychrosphaera sp.]|uniref:hybrid sensor histidine kinase/response regulator n=1 Tax=uncultured Psychrosphaera sp. TaxID=1403522 RepID=UPI0030F5AEE0